MNYNATYSFSRFEVKVHVLNLIDTRQIVNEEGGFYTWQSSREI